MSKKLCKIIYFDEDSTTDYVQIVSGGELEKTTELLKKQSASEEQKAEAKVSAGIGGIFKALIGFNASVDGDISAGLSFDSDKMVKNIIKNTLLTDFIDILEEESSKAKKKKYSSRSAINKFEGYSISVAKDSLSYMVMVSPYLGMLKNGTTIPAGEFSISMDKLDGALRKAKGYYEFIGTKNKRKVVLRFNINAFKNGYSLNDLLKMNLSIYAIKVGKTSLDMLSVSKELEMNIPTVNKDNPSYVTESKETDNVSSRRNWDVYDVLLAGVEIDE